MSKPVKTEKYFTGFTIPKGCDQWSTFALIVPMEIRREVDIVFEQLEGLHGHEQAWEVRVSCVKDSPADLWFKSNSIFGRWDEK